MNPTQDFELIEAESRALYAESNARHFKEILEEIIEWYNLQPVKPSLPKFEAWRKSRRALIDEAPQHLKNFLEERIW